jgi:hypothetical protein
LRHGLPQGDHRNNQDSSRRLGGFPLIPQPLLRLIFFFKK